MMNTLVPNLQQSLTLKPLQNNTKYCSGVTHFTQLQPVGAESFKTKEIVEMDNTVVGSNRPKVEYVLFDMDGLMIDSERVYSEVTNAILSRYGYEMTWDIKAGCMGKPERPSVEYLLSFFPGIPLTVDEYIKERREKQDLSWPGVKPLPGVMKLVDHLKVHNIPMVVATGSITRNFLRKSAHLPELFEPFGDKIVCGDDPRVAAGKPSPDVFLIAAEVLGREVGKGDVAGANKNEIIERSKGLVFEDATNGVQAAKRAGMQIVWVPDPNLRALDPSEDLGADCIINSVEDFRPEEWGLPPFGDQP